ncbi:Biosynthetic peptidoglycan transglycosylase [Cupriavidus respiraculi]|uniref:Biosynthetic peptidoglycan transglycosylase n=2 Tax=Cupriavidus respiraculi TaxID=195930 RepID=A0ABN7Y7H3_9BURK|nr:Biosynthetic peptidoglycan transglycosylase [Cupriavidus respiraculi]
MKRPNEAPPQDTPENTSAPADRTLEPGSDLPGRMPVGARAQGAASRIWQRLRHPTWRGVAIAAGAVPALLAVYALILIPFTPGISDIRKAKLEQPAQVLSADGKELAVFKRANRDWVKLADISPNVIAALISTEDHRFYQHHGLDWRRTASAALLTFSGDRQGGSTITQQLARNLYPDEVGRAPTFTRKLKEAITAFKIEALYTKDEILETYLNTVPFLYNAYGIEMAARTYFDKSADQLDVLESATLIGMLKGTSYYNPVLNPERAVERRNIVLGQMVKRDRLDAARYEALKKRPLRIDFERQTAPNGPAPHFAQHLRKWLIAWADSNDYNIYTDGLVVHTTIDSRLQALANQAVARQGERLQGVANAVWSPRSAWGNNRELVHAFVRETREYQAAIEAGQSEEQALKSLLADAAFMRTLREQKTMIQAGFLALDPVSGQIKAWVGSRDFASDAFDHVQQARRQPGSTFKPFVYGAAFEQGTSPDTTLVDQVVEIPLSGGEVWRPSDATPPSGRPMTLRDGLVYSRNTITAQLMQSVGPNRVARLARAMGVRHSELDVVPSLALGTSPVTLKEMVSSYGTIANGGSYIEPTMVLRIEDRDGNVLEEFHPPAAERALPARAAHTLLDVMRDVVERGTGSSIRRRYGIRADVAGKTGTTQDNADGWFILMHPQLVAGAWVGFNDSRITLRSDYWGQGAHSALPMVGDFFQRSLRARVIDARVRFAEHQESSFFDPVMKQIQGWFEDPAAPASEAEPAPVPRRTAPPVDVPTEAATAAEPAPSAPEETIEPAQEAPGSTPLETGAQQVFRQADGSAPLAPPASAPAPVPSPASPAPQTVPRPAQQQAQPPQQTQQQQQQQPSTPSPPQPSAVQPDVPPSNPPVPAVPAEPAPATAP